jgi:hypothetical protein
MASLADMPTRRGLAFRWQTIIVAFIVWNGLFLLGLHYATLNSVPGAPGFLLLAPALLLAVSILTPRIQMLRRLAINPGRDLSEVRPVLNLFALVCGILPPVFGTVIAFGGLRQTRSPD